MACLLSPKNCTAIFPRLIATWQARLRADGARCSGSILRQTGIALRSPHTRLSVGLGWTCSCVLGCPSNVCLNCPCRRAPSPGREHSSVSVPPQACGTARDPRPSRSSPRRTTTAPFTANAEAKISFPANIQTKSKHTTEPWYQNLPRFHFRLERQFFMKVKTVPFYGLTQFWRHFFRNIIIMAKLCICCWAGLWKQQYWLQS